MDRDALVKRNQQMAEAFHQVSVKHRVRQRMVRALANFPFAPLTTKVKRVLFIRPDHIGDMLLATPAICALKNAQPLTEIHVLAGPWSAPILHNFAEIDQTLTIRFPGFDRQASQTNPVEPYLQALRVSRQLRRIGYSSVVIMRPDHWWGALLAHIAGIRERVGYDMPDVAPFLTHTIPFQREHVIRQNMRLVEHWTGHIEDGDVPYHLPVYDIERGHIDELLKQWGTPHTRQMICIHPGAGTRVKQWDAQKWAQVADALIEQTDAQIIFTGSANELGLVTQIQNLCTHKTYTTSGELSLEQLTALYERVQLVIGCDSGPLHMAAAVNTPTVALFGPADPMEFGQWGDRHKHVMLFATIACRPCRVLDWGDDELVNHPCMREIGIGDVLEASRRILNA